jgi:hypothetical protein
MVSFLKNTDDEKMTFIPDLEGFQELHSGIEDIQKEICSHFALPADMFMPTDQLHSARILIATLRQEMQTFVDILGCILLKNMIQKGHKMQQYIGTKMIQAEPMTRGKYNEYRGWTIPENENPDDGGYLVVYPDGYESWSPQNVFEEAYRPTIGMNFGLAIEAAKKGFKITRRGWNGKDMFVVYMPPLQLPPYNTQGTARKVNDRTAKFIGEDAPLNCQPYFSMYNAQKQWIPGWLATQSDMLSDDWYIVE